MENKRNILVAGGDLRQVYAAQALSKHKAYSVTMTGFQRSQLPDHLAVLPEPDGQTMIDILVLPIPAADSAGFVAAPFNSTPLALAELLNRMQCGGLVLGGGDLPSGGIEQEKQLDYCNYLRQEALSIANAVPTAEGALQIAMEKTAYTIAGSHVLVLGYGRIGTVLAAQLHALHAHVTVAARQQTDRIWAAAAGCSAKSVKTAVADLSSYDMIFNTVPALLLDETALKTVRNDALVLDLASRPGGVDFTAAQAMGKTVVWALSLPPNTTGSHNVKGKTGNFYKKNSENRKNTFLKDKNGGEL